jgi:hypothetical protein
MLIIFFLTTFRKKGTTLTTLDYTRGFRFGGLLKVIANINDCSIVLDGSLILNINLLISIVLRMY